MQIGAVSDCRPCNLDHVSLQQNTEFPANCAAAGLEITYAECSREAHYHG
jgi:hypothetical protein